ncbi:Pre-mRNA-splicing ATP-dependent RNA helicase PRP28 [Ceratocystis fimbriata CBS 114723]|uniref:RNA helicase n=2 Tax=Ceratocystis TaxID=5157 RepID=A0A0F8B277_CERFI|nr:Pre-mRNA-splicing ATP-dependent RNA helicase PRP28 [Ceratocystis platani]PHH49778.1 Pre-mRNA-splicing ATP-dependent RNA helicase PRP28 [Ceratocystis fimbriata CBS 114723]
MEPSAKKPKFDLDDFLKKKKEAEEAARKPRWIPKAQREALAKKQKEEEELKKQQSKAIAEERDRKWLQGEKAKTPTSTPTPRTISAAHEAMRAERGTGKFDTKKWLAAGLTQADITEERKWREHYLGPDVNKESKFVVKRKRTRAGEQFNFDWSPEDDTTRTDTITELPRKQQRSAPKQFYTWDERFDANAEERLKEQIKFIEQKDPETGRERGQELLREFYRGRERAIEKDNKTGMGRHWSKKKLSEMKQRDWRIFKEDFGIATKGGGLPDPMRSWRESDLPDNILHILDSVGFDEPSPIQRAAIPIALQARDLIGVAVTGSGKTLAFLLPLLVYISDLPPLTEVNKNDGPYALIMAPTRELVQQIEKEARRFARPMGYRVVSIVGGHSLEEQAYALRDGAHIIVATPGRLVDCIERRMIVFAQCCYVIMDEADRMIDLGFEEPVNKILDALPLSNQKPDTEDAEDSLAMKQYISGRDRYRQTMMYTATMPAQVERIAKKYLRRPAIVTIGNAGEAVDTVEQRVEFVSGEDRRKARLKDIIMSHQYAPPIIVFVNIKRNCETVAREIKHMGMSVVTLHGSKTQEQREAALASVRNGQTQILVATDLAGRGIDVPDVSLVINFNMATNIESYTHRIGRTGRAGKSGVAITFLGNEDSDVLYDLKQILSKSSISKVPDELRRHEAAQQKPNRMKQQKPLE